MNKHAPTKMTREHNKVIAFSKIDIAPIERLDESMIASIARSHKVDEALLIARLEERKARMA